MVHMNASIGAETKIWHPDLVNIYGCTIGKKCNIGAFVEIGPNVVIGDRVRIAAHCFIPEGVTIEDDCFIGPRVTFTNDPYPPGTRDNWRTTLVRRKASIGAGAIILPGVVIGEGALVGAGSIISRDVSPGAKVYGAKAEARGFVGIGVEECGGAEVNRCPRCGRRECICERLKGAGLRYE